MSEQPRTILFVHPSDELYGADRVLLEIVRGLPRRYRALVVLPRDIAYDGALSRELHAAGALVRHCDMAVLRRANLHPLRLPRLLWRLVAGSLRLAQTARRERVALIHSNTVAVPCGVVAALLTRRPHLWDIHEHLADEPAPLRALLRLAVSIAPGRVLANSRSSARSIVAGSRRRARKTRVLYYGVEDMPLPDDIESAVAPLTIGFLGRLTPRKGTDQALEAVALVHTAGVALVFQVYGSAAPGQEWREDALRRRADALGIGEVTTWHGFTPDARAHLPEIDILLVPSQRPEPFGLVLVEGMLARRVVIASRNGGGSDEILEDGRTGLYCGRDPQSIAAAIVRVASDPALRAEIGAAARCSALERFGLERFQRDMLTVYDALVGRD